MWGKPMTALEDLPIGQNAPALSGADALLLIGHGSVRYPAAGIAMERIAATLRGGAWAGPVAVAVLNGEPSVAQALDALDAVCVRVVPFFMEDGYFTRVAVPRALGSGHGSRRIVLCAPIGVHDGMAGLIERQALAACRDLGVASRETAVVIVGHGSAREPGRALALHRHASRVASTELFARVEAACLEEAPFVADTLAGLRAHPVVVIGFFANQGGHVRDDLPGLIADEVSARGREGPVVRLCGCVVDDPAVAQIVLDQALGGEATAA
jgi:sirohydrochlorin cobaltochelatase